ncbi:MAG: Fmu (Sun) domain-containing protein [Desulfovibrio sp.]|jgi:16S rRNA (cytosine967-C5)-methyltransferase|nr:Fmu (Sun) domain-containing protein [Desulfovibrio sp.]
MTRSTLPGLGRKAGHDPRTAALSVLHAVLCAGEDSQAALDRHLVSPEMVPTDKRLCTELVYGALRAYGALREDVDALLGNPDGLPLEMRLALCLAWYELDRLRVPPHAAIHRTVRHIRNRFGPGLAGVANGVLRSLLRRRSAGTDPCPQADPSRSSAGDDASLKQDTFAPSSALWAASPPAPAGARKSRRRGGRPLTQPPEQCPSETALARRHAMPPWIVRLWREQYGSEAALSFLAASSGRPPSGLRLNRRAPGWEEDRRALLEEAPPGLAPLRVGEAALAFPGSLPWQARRLLAEGRASRQSAASYQALFALDPVSWPQPIWDACAGRGGKTLALLEAGIPVALASDPSSVRLRALCAEYIRLAPLLPLPALLSQSATEEPFLPPSPAEGPGGEELFRRPASPDVRPAFFRTILVDAPCSGLGTLARRPEIRLRRTPAHLRDLAASQRAILDAVWDRLLPGGRLLYLTCTLNKAENEDQIAAFLLRHPRAVRVGEFQTPPSSPLREFFYAAHLEKGLLREFILPAPGRGPAGCRENPEDTC